VKLRDAVWGVLLLALAGVLLVHMRGFPAMPGQKIGPAALPTLLAIGLAVCGAVMLVNDLRTRQHVPWVEWPEWIASRPQVVALLVLVAINVFYLLAVDRLGFIPTGAIYLAAFMTALRVRPLRAIVIAFVCTLAIHYAFYKLLKVPLPWGVLQGVAW
jgi:putative tricarboxylic transport membrane protein